METLLPVLATGLFALAGALISFHAGRAGRMAQNTQTLLDLTERVQKLNDELSKLKKDLDTFSHKNSVLWKYIYALIDQMHLNGLTPPTPPAELDTDPKLQALLRTAKG